MICPDPGNVLVRGFLAVKFAQFHNWGPMTGQSRRAAFGLILFLITAASLEAQSKITILGITDESKESGSITVRVWGPDHKPMKQRTLVHLFYPALSTGPIKTLLMPDTSQVVFPDLPELGHYRVEVASAGYQTAKQDLDYVKILMRFEIDATMQPTPVNKDVEPGLAPAIGPKAQKQLQKGLAALQSGNLKSARKELAAAYLLAPTNSDICYLSGVTSIRLKDLEHGRSFLELAIASEPKNVPALVALGQLHDLEGDYAGATEALEKVISIDPSQNLARWVLADVYLRRGENEKARQEAEEAVESGEGAANKAEFIEGEALAQLGRRDDAVKLFASFVRDVPGDSAIPDARRFLTEFRASDPAESTVAAKSGAVAQAIPPPNMTLPPFELLISTWEPLDVDRVRPIVSEGVTCPAERVIQGVGERVTELVENVNNIAATEKVVYESLNSMGRPFSPESRKYDYTASITDDGGGLPVIDETRLETSGLEGLPQAIAPFALQDLALVFHPELRNDFQMTCEGLGKWRGQGTWVVYFRQRPDRPKRLRSYEADGRFYSAGLKGRAWISADSYQIVRMEADLMAPVPEIGLGSEEDAIEYGPVAFESKKTELWLPITADIYIYFHHRTYRRHHFFTNYLIFSVGSTQKISPPKINENK